MFMFLFRHSVRIKTQKMENKVTRIKFDPNNNN